MGRDSGKKGKSSYRRQLKDTSRGARVNRGRFASSSRTSENKELNEFDRLWGYEIFSEHAERRERLGWLLNVLPTTVADDSRLERSAVDLFFLEQNGKKFKTTIMYNPYFYVAVRDSYHKDVAVLLERKFEGIVASIEIVRKEDLDMPNHLSGKLGVFLKLSFRNVQDLLSARRVLFPIVDANRKSEKTSHHAAAQGEDTISDYSRMIVDIREYDVPYYVRCMIDLDYRVGAWYKVIANKSGKDNKVDVVWQKDLLLKANPSVLAFDIECTKSPLKFPDADVDEIFMISYMVDGKGYLIVSRTVVSKNISDFEYTPKAEYPGPFKVFNEVNEEALIRRFFKHIRELCPDIIVTYNGDFFDLPFVDRRAQMYGLNLKTEIGMEVDRMGESYVGRTMSHMDAFSWVRRDSYLPQGSQGLKNVTKYKLGYNPVEVDPEDMVRFAVERPDHMASYSVSDAVATYYLYMKYVHLFIFSLCTVIPMRAADVLRKGSGTLCEMLLQVEAYRGNIICPNKQRQRSEAFHKGHLLDSETYVGGHVESLESGVFRSDLPCKFKVDPKSYQMLIDNIDRALTFSVEVEYGIERSEIANYDEVRSEIVHQLELIRDRPVREEIPFIYHLDVAAMYPNIILTNRLQPSAIVDASTCAACDYNRPGANCRRKMPWTWRGDMFPAKRSEYEALKTQLEYESVDGVPFHKLAYPERNAAVRARLKTYSQTVYKKTKKTEMEDRVAVVCQRENSFYVNTVRSFRDRRYDYKGLKKKWSRKVKAAKRINDVVAAEEARNKTLLYDSLQLAHKCILNSFYGYVMRKGARWYSMEMAGAVTKTGANLIKQARILVEGIGRPLELDTDGIWCILPGSFPENFTFKLKDGKPINISYPCVMLNVDVHKNYTNHQYQVLKKGADPRKPQFTARSECSIFFEVDGPYKCMVLPASTEEGKLLKKRYAVFNFDGSLAELKGFELKRRGELKIVKIFQSQVFKQFLKGQTLKECYDAVAEIANRWIDVLATHGEDMEDDEVIELISENRSMSRALKEYGDQKSTSITTARRLGEFLGDEMVKDKGLQCKMIISRMPAGAPVTERAVPTAIFSADPAQRQHFLRKWCKDKSLSGSDIDVRSIVDWDYYMERLSSNIRKIITIPAALQKQKNPVPRVAHPAWLVRKVRSENDGRTQLKINDMFTAAPLMDIENMGNSNTSNRAGVPRVTVKKRKSRISFSKKRIKSREDTSMISSKMEVVDEEKEQEEEEKIDESTFEGWLKSRKKKWREIRVQNMEEKNLVAGRRNHHQHNNSRKNKNAPIQNKSLASTNNSFATFARSAGSNILRGYWQIIRITATSNPGLFTVWAFTSTSTIESISIRVSRVFYVNSTTPNSKGGERVERSLPHGRDAKYLYRIEVDEEKWIRRSKRLDRLVMDADIEGVYV